MSGNSCAASSTETISMSRPRYLARDTIIFKKSCRSGVQASISPAVMWMPQDWPEIASISL